MLLAATLLAVACLAALASADGDKPKVFGIGLSKVCVRLGERGCYARRWMPSCEMAFFVRSTVLRYQRTRPRLALLPLRFLVARRTHGEPERGIVVIRKCHVSRHESSADISADWQHVPRRRA